VGFATNDPQKEIETNVVLEDVRDVYKPKDYLFIFDIIFIWFISN